MTQELEGKVALVTGGATLIGAEVAKAFAAAGAKVLVGDIAEDGPDELTDAHPDTVRYVRADITNDADIDGLIATAESWGGGLDMVVNVAGTYEEAGLDTDRRTWLAGLDVNVVGPAILVQRAAPAMARRGGGSVVHFGSISGRVAQRGRAMYAVSKAAILHMVRVQAVALAAEGIRVNAVSPGMTWSDPIAQLSGGDRAHADAVGARTHPLGRIADPAEVAEAVLFLAGPRASFITGTDLAVDGGYAAWGPERADDVQAQVMGDRRPG